MQDEQESRDQRSPQHAGQENPPRLRSYACLRCSRRKQRCDRLLPICSSCRRAGKPCRSSQKEDNVVVLDNDEILRKGYIRILEEKLARLQQKAHDKGLRTEEEEAQEETAAAANPPETPGNMSMRLLSLSTMAEPRTLQGRFLLELSLPRIISSLTEMYGGDPETTRRADMAWESVARHVRHAGTGQGPSGQPLYFAHLDASRFLDTYVEFVDSRFPRIPFNKVRHGIEILSSHDDDKFRIAMAKNPAHIFMAYMVIAIVPLVAIDHDISRSSFLSTHIPAESLKVLEQVFREEDGVDIIHCLHLLVVYSLHYCTAGSSWHLIGLAIKKCVALGYHREAPVANPADEIVAEDRRWAFWSCYLIDRLVSAALGRPTSINDADITVVLPNKPLSSSREQAHIQLFLYARLMSDVLKAGGHRSFSCHLGQILDWKLRASQTWSPSSTGTLQTFSVGEHQDSLHNTLLLRVAIDQINRHAELRDGTPESSSDTVGYPPSWASSQALTSRRQDRLGQLRLVKLAQICSKVAQSLNRTSMRRRSYLSWITGYSALSAALAAVYCIHVIHLPENPQPSTPAMSEYRESLQDLDQTVLDACHILAEVGRQFPRMAQYCQLITSLRKQLVCDDTPAFHQLITITSTLMGSPNTDTKDIEVKPLHLRKLVTAILDA